MTIDTTAGDTIGTDRETEADAPEEPRELPLDLTFEILKNQRRRLVLDHLRSVDGETTIGELAEHIAAIENDCDVQALGAQQRKRVYIGLYQCHLPKMDDAGVVDFNQSRGRVELRREAEQLFEYLSDDEEEEDETTEETDAGSADPVPYAAATVGIGALFGLSQFLGYYLLASGLVFAFLVTTLYLGRRGLFDR
ncbi:DUF7344 domain-containing protein [Halobaculum lipolyticum]|uniref:DUF7344 domain-containing protein n=1 Tax=Halobaculum lipolyticum TaxID=3032001 RepID=A0ABD5W8N0_9EURY